MDYIATYALVAVAGWALALVTWALKRSDRDNNRQLDCIMALVDKEKAAMSASLGEIRARSRNGKTGAAAVDKKRSELAARRKRLDKLHDEVTEAGVITPEQESELAKYANLS